MSAQNWTDLEWQNPDLNIVLLLSLESERLVNENHPDLLKRLDESTNLLHVKETSEAIRILKNIKPDFVLVSDDFIVPDVVDNADNLIYHQRNRFIDETVTEELADPDTPVVQYGNRDIEEIIAETLAELSQLSDSDPAIAETSTVAPPGPADVLKALKEYVVKGGTVIFCCDFITLTTADRLDAFWKWWGLPWKWASTYKTTVQLNPFAGADLRHRKQLPQQHQPRAVFFSGVEPSGRFYVPSSQIAELVEFQAKDRFTTTDGVDIAEAPKMAFFESIDSSIEGKVRTDIEMDIGSLTETSVVRAFWKEGCIACVGNLTDEKENIKIILTMCRVEEQMSELNR